MTTDAPDRQRWADHDADFTPRDLVRQGLAEVLRLVELVRGEAPDIRVAWDPSAGAGVFGEVFRELLPADVITVAHEIREEERANLERNYDLAKIGSCLVSAPLLAVHGAGGRAGVLVATNPPWGNLWPRIARVAIERADLVVLLGPTTWGSSREPSEALDLFEVLPPWAQLKVPGRVHFRSGVNPRTGRRYTADNRKVSWWVWGRGLLPLVRDIGTTRPRWATVVLDELPLASRRWVVRPGTLER